MAGGRNRRRLAAGVGCLVRVFGARIFDATVFDSAVFDSALFDATVFDSAVLDATVFDATVRLGSQLEFLNDEFPTVSGPATATLRRSIAGTCLESANARTGAGSVFPAAPVRGLPECAEPFVAALILASARAAFTCSNRARAVPG